MTASRLGLPLSFQQEGLHSGATGGTVFPEPLLTACTWNESLVVAIGAALADEARGVRAARSTQCSVGGPHTAHPPPPARFARRAGWRGQRVEPRREHVDR